MSILCRKFRGNPCAVALLFVVLAGVSAVVSAENPVTVVVEVTVPDRGALDALVKAGFDIGNVRDHVATVYAAPDDLTRLRVQGYTFRKIERQPNPPTFDPGAKGLGVYHSYASFTTELQTYAAAHPNICRLSSLGQSVQGREIWAVLITDNPDVEEDEPEFKYVSSMHGDEPVGAEMCLYLINRLLSGYGTDNRVTSLVNATAIWIVPLMNPDGLELGRRGNANGYDLNRSFPIYSTNFVNTAFDGEPLHDAGRQPEVAAVLRWTAGHSFVLSANFHTGALVVNYPYDDDGLPSGADAPSPDDALFRDVSMRYSYYNPPMWSSPYFANGITNGTAWYVAIGGMQDWNYRYAGCNEVTIELSDIKRPAQAQLPGFWGDNEESMLRYMEAVQIGVRGLVVDEVTDAPLWAEVTVQGNAHPVFSDPDVGDYHRMLLPGTYALTFSAPGYGAATVSGIVVGDGPATRVDVALALLQEPEPDVNGDGVTDALDVQFVINVALGLDSPFDADVNHDGQVNAVDIQLVINAALGMEIARHTTPYTYRIANTYPHDRAAFTQGLVFDGAFLYESTGLWDSSSLRRVDLETGNVVQNHRLDSQYFGEGLTLFGDHLIQLTWQNHVGFVYTKDTFADAGQFAYSTEGWGITHDGVHLIMSDGTDTLHFLDPATFAETGQVHVYDDDGPVTSLNELEYVRGQVYANVWTEDLVARIAPRTGRVTGWIDLSGLLSAADRIPFVDVLNGIAYDPDSGRLFVTGKLWPKLFEIEIVPAP